MARHALVDRPAERSKLIGWYRQALREQEASGLSVTAYAESIGVTAATLYAWRRRLSTGDPCDSQGGRFGLVEIGPKVGEQPDPLASGSTPTVVHLTTGTLDRSALRL